jgi:hypothetical protein
MSCVLSLFKPSWSRDIGDIGIYQSLHLRGGMKGMEKKPSVLCTAKQSTADGSRSCNHPSRYLLFLSCPLGVFSSFGHCFALIYTNLNEAEARALEGIGWRETICLFRCYEAESWCGVVWRRRYVLRRLVGYVMWSHPTLVACNGGVMLQGQREGKCIWTESRWVQINTSQSALRWWTYTKHMR